MKKILFILTVFFFAVSTSFSQYNYDSTKVRPEILKIVKSISKVNEVCSRNIGYGGTASKQYKRFEKLKRNASRSELLELTNHPNAVIRCYSFWGLRDMHDPSLFDILMKHITDSALVITYEYDVKRYEKVADFCIQFFLKKYNSEEDRYVLNPNYLSTSQKYLLDSLLIFTPNTLEYTSKILMEIDPKLGFYLRVRELAKSGNIYAVVALAKYRNQEDIEIILNSKYYNTNNSVPFYPAIYYTFKAISYFPDLAFRNLLVEYSNKKENRYSFNDERSTFFLAVASYKDSLAEEMLNYKTERDFYWIFKAIEEFNSPVYNLLKFAVWEERNIITRKSLNYLFSVDSIRTVKDILASLDDSKFFMDNHELYYCELDNPGKVINKMLDTIISIDRNLSIGIISKKITFSTGEDLEVFTKKAAQLKDSTLLKELISRIKNSTKDFKNDDYWYIMEAILSFKQPEAEQMLYDEIIENKEVMITKFKNKTSEVKKRIEMVKEWIEWEKEHEEYFRIYDEIHQY